jgi:hypothetical protein
LVAVEQAAYRVIPVPGGWAIEQPCGEHLMFRSGGHAEAKAHELARQAHRRGEAAEVIIHDRNGIPIGRRSYGLPDEPRANLTDFPS